MSLKLHSRGENRNSCLLCLFFFRIGFLSILHFRLWRDVQEPEEPEDAAAAGISANRQLRPTVTELH